MFESLYCTWSRICCGQHPTNSPTILAPCRNSLSDFNELCWSSLHHYTSLLGRQRSPGKSIVLSFLSCRCESTSVKSPSMHLCHLPFGSVTSLPHTPSETTSKKLNKLQGGLRCVGGILPFCFWPFRKKKKSLKNFVAKDTTSSSSVQSNHFLPIWRLTSGSYIWRNGMDHYMPSCCGSANVTGQQRRRYIAFGLQN